MGLFVFMRKKKGDIVIIEAQNGYELGSIVVDPTYKDSAFMIIEVLTGTLCGMVLTIESQCICEYSENTVDNMTKKHGYEKRFSKGIIADK